MRASTLFFVLLLMCVAAFAQDTFKNPPPESDNVTEREKFHWGSALAQSGMFLGVLHGINARQYTVPHDHFFRRYAESVGNYRWNTWFDGNSGVTNNLGHPFEGAIAGSIELQNDSSGRVLRIGRDSRYWNSRMRALAWATAFSFQWEIGPLSEASLGNYGSSTWIKDGRVVNGTGLSDVVMTPLGGFGWIVAEDAVDRWMFPHAPCMSKKRRAVWTALTPARSVANLLRFKKPWYRDALPDQCLAGK